MISKRKVNLALAALLCFQTVGLYGSTSVASSPAAPAVAAVNETACAVSFELSMQENDSIHMFHAKLSHLLYHYGKASFESQLNKIIADAWPQARMIQVSPFFFEQAQNMIDQERLKNAVARTIGLETNEWYQFERNMRSITLLGGIDGDGFNPFEKSAKSLLAALNAYNDRSSEKSAEDFANKKAEAILRTATMFAYLVRQKNINSVLIDERAQAAGQTMAIVAVGLVGATVLGTTLFVSAPIVTGAGAMAGGLSANPVVAGLLVKAAEIAAGSAIGLVGAPAAILVDDSFKTISEAGKQSANRQTSYACELSKQIKNWKDIAGDRLLSAALVGAGMGAAGGLASVTNLSARLVLYGTGLGVGVAQLYAVGKLSQTAVESIGYFRLAEEAEAAGNHQQALEYLYRARDLAQESQEYGLQSIIIGALSYHVGAHFREALSQGQSAIRQLYAASADTIPTAAHSVTELTQSIGGAVKSGK